MALAKNFSADDVKEQDEIAETINAWKKTRSDLEKKRLEYRQKGAFIKFPEHLKVALQLLSAKKCMGYQTYLKMVLADHLTAQIKAGEISKAEIDHALAERSDQVSV